MKEERRLVWRVLRHWTEISHSRRFPRRDEIDPWMRGENGANSLLIAVEVERVNDFDTAGGRSLGSEFWFL